MLAEAGSVTYVEKIVKAKTSRSLFPPADAADENGIVCYGGDWTAILLLERLPQWDFSLATRRDANIVVFARPAGGVLYFEQLHLSKSFEEVDEKTKL